jgi:hypothetical protein
VRDLDPYKTQLQATGTLPLRGLSAWELVQILSDLGINLTDAIFVNNKVFIGVGNGS